MGIIVPYAVELWDLLHLDRAKSVAQSDGRYKGRRVPATRASFERHLGGDITLAFTVLCSKYALFAVLDIDACFTQMLPDIRRAVLALGGAELYQAIFCTNGSDAGRGKVIVTFAELVPACDARRLMQQLCRRVRASASAQSLEPQEISAYPQHRSGGVVRVLGRNSSRGGPIEQPFSLDGEVGVAHARPLTSAKLAEIVVPECESIAPWAKRLIESPWRKIDRHGTYGHFGHMIALGRDAIRVYGIGRGRQVYDEWLDRVKANSPELSQPTLKTSDRRNLIDHARERAWEYACRLPNSWLPLDLQIRKGMPRGVVRVYNALVVYVRNKGLLPTHFAIDYERIARMVDSSKSTAHRWVMAAERMGVLVIHDHGSRHTPGQRGKCTSLGLVCHDQTPEEVRARHHSR